MTAVLKRVLIILVVVIVVGAVAGLFITAPQKLASSEFPADYKPNVENGKVIFTAANCSARP